MCRNPALTRLIAQALEGTPGGAALVERYTRALQAATTDGSSTATPEVERTTVQSSPSLAPTGVIPNRSGHTAPGRGRSGAPASRPNVNPPSVNAPRAATPSANLAQVTGQVLEVVPRPAARPASPATAGASARWVFLVSISLACVVVGWLRQGR
jgi:hypothetical protein